MNCLLSIKEFLQSMMDFYGVAWILVLVFMFISVICIILLFIIIDKFEKIRDEEKERNAKHKEL